MSEKRTNREPAAPPVLPPDDLSERSKVLWQTVVPARGIRSAGRLARPCWNKRCEDLDGPSM